MITEYSSKFFTEVKNIRDRNEDIYFTYRPVSGSMMGVGGFFSGSLMIQSG